jgi:uncharacterized protein YqgV (UPF0045/DUF77 family)
MLVRLEAEFTSEPFHGEGSPPEHAVAARDAAAEAGLDTDFGPFGTLARGDAEDLLGAIPAIAKAALEGGATKVTLQVRRAGADKAETTGPSTATGGKPAAGEPRGAGKADPESTETTGNAADLRSIATTQSTNIPRSTATTAGGTNSPESTATSRNAADSPSAATTQNAADPQNTATTGSTTSPEGTATTSGSANSPTVELNDALARLIADVERELGAELGKLDRSGKQRAVRLLRERGAFGLRKSVSSVADALGVTRFTVYNYLNREAD